MTATCRRDWTEGALRKAGRQAGRQTAAVASPTPFHHQNCQREEVGVAQNAKMEDVSCKQDM